jgi:Flp pilus assembly protein CpaB
MRLRSLLDGPRPALPRPLDAAAEGWAGLPPRLRLAAFVLALIALVGAMQARISHVEARWGGPPVDVLVAGEELHAGTAPAHLRRVQLPPAAVPPHALREAPAGEVLTTTLPEGAVLTRGHLHPRGPAAALGSDRRAVPIPVEDTWGVAPGGWVDLWMLGGDGRPASRIATGRRVLEVSGDAHEATALVELHVDEVGPAGAGLALGRLLLAHAPAPGDPDGRR